MARLSMIHLLPDLWNSLLEPQTILVAAWTLWRSGDKSLLAALVVVLKAEFLAPAKIQNVFQESGFRFEENRTYLFGAEWFRLWLKSWLGQRWRYRCGARTGLFGCLVPHFPGITLTLFSFANFSVCQCARDTSFLNGSKKSSKLNLYFFKRLFYVNFEKGMNYRFITK